MLGRMPIWKSTGSSRLSRNRSNLMNVPPGLVRAARSVFNAPDWISRILFRDIKSGAFMLRLNGSAHWFVGDPDIPGGYIYLSPAGQGGQDLADDLHGHNADMRHDRRVARYQDKVACGVCSGVRLKNSPMSGPVGHGQSAPDTADNSGRLLPAIPVS